MSIFIVDGYIILDFSVFSPFLVVSTGAARIVSKITYYMYVMCRVGRGVAIGGYMGIYTPKIGPGKLFMG